MVPFSAYLRAWDQKKLSTSLLLSGVRNVHTRPEWGSQRSHNSQFPMFEDKIYISEKCPTFPNKTQPRIVPTYLLPGFPTLNPVLRCSYVNVIIHSKHVPFPLFQHRTIEATHCGLVEPVRNSGNHQLRLLVHPTIYTHLSMNFRYGISSRPQQYHSESKASQSINLCVSMGWLQKVRHVWNPNQSWT